ncbi:MAG: MG2 domain-containing protein [Syntrophales bacterium]|nr:MG2 domain-containing protein [Syntrophales bacterium]
MESGKQVSGGRIKRAKALLGGHRSWTVFGALLVLLLLAGAGMGESWSKKEAAAKAAFDPAKHFTIEKIEPDAAKEEIRVFFSQPLPLGFLRQHLRLLPRSKVDWNRSTLTDKGVLTLKGTFVYGTTYGIALPGDQKIQKRTYLPTISSFKMPDRPPKVEFVGKKSVIELDSRQLLHVRTQNVGSLLLEEVKLPPVLLPLALAAKKDPESWAPELEVLRKAAGQSQKLVQSQKGLAPFWGQLREQKQLFAAPAEKNKVQAVSLPLTFRQDPKQGLMSLIRVINPQDPKVGTGPRVFRVTDLGLTYKLGQGSLLLWVTSLKTCAPLAGAQVAAISRDLEIFPLGATDKDGILIWQDRDLEGISLKQLGEFTTVKRRVARENLRFLLVAVKGDVSYIELQPQGDLKPVGVWQATGKEQGRTLTGQVFTERGVYRPGEQVFYKGTIREYAGGKITPPAGNMVSFEVRNPKGDQVYSRSLKLSEFGTAAGVIKVEPQWPLGTYTLTLKFGNKAIPPEAQKAEPGADEDDDFLAANQKRNTTECTFQVQEFKPPRHFAEVSFQRFTKSVKDQNQKEAPREFVRIKISGSYYAGGPVKNGQVRWKIYHTKTSFQVPGQDDFTFGCVGEEKGEMLEGGQAVLDEKGSLVLEFPLDRQVLSGQNGLLVLATVVDFDGRAATATKTMQVEPDYLVGISVHPERVKAHLNQVLRLRLAKPDGKLLQEGAIQVEILAQRWGYVAKLNERGNVFWQDQEVWRHSGGADLKLKKGEASYRFDFSQGGRYRLAFSYQDEKGRRFTSTTFYDVMGDIYWDAESRKEKPFQTLALAADQKAYKPGQTARLTISPPQPVARYLMTLEQNGVLQHRVLSAQQGLQVLKLPIQAKYAPNVYVSVLGLTPRGDFPVLPGRYDSEAPSFYWGNLNLPVRLEVEPLMVKISPGTKDLKFEPGAKVELDFLAQTPDGKGVEAELAVAVVDEAVLALTGFKTPTLDKLVRFDQPLTVYTGELRALLVHQTPFYMARSESLTGGGGMSEAALAQLRKRFEAVAYFNPEVHTDNAGQAKVSFTLPDNMTTYRVYVVAQNKGSRFASPERPLLATKDFYLEPGIPGFFTKGDRFQFQVAAFNQTATAGPVKFSAGATGGLSLEAVKSGVNLPAKDSIKLPVAGEAKTPGPATAKFTGEFQQKSDGVELPVKINSGYLRETTVTLGSFSGRKTLKVPLPAYLTGDVGKKVGVQEVKAYLTLAGSPFVKMSRAIQYLLHYPYGCVEQTSSGVLALASLRGLVKAGQVSGVSLEEVDKYLQKGVARLLHLQLGDGGFPYWPGQPRAHPWGSVYATAALLQAQAQGLPVPKAVLNDACNYLRATIRKQVGSPSFGPFVIYLLSLNKSLDRSTFNLVSRDYQRLPQEGRLVTILAARQSGFKTVKDLVPALKPLLEGKPGAAGPDDEFMARYRTPALALLAAEAVMPQDPLTARTAAALLGGLGQQGIWTSTSDTGWALVALGQHFIKAKFKGEPGKVKVSQPQGPTYELTLDPKRPQTLTLDAAALLKKPAVNLEGEPGRSWMYQLELIFPRLDLAPTGAAHGFKVTRTIANTDGSKEIRVGDLVKVTVQVEPTTSTTRYVVIDDPLPAGLVAVNPVFQTEEPTPDAEDRFDYFSPEGLMRFRPNHLEMREDRVLAFRNWVYAGPQVFEYYARAVCQGAFVVPATKVSAMYAPLTYGCTAKGEITILGR